MADHTWQVLPPVGSPYTDQKKKPISYQLFDASESRHGLIWHGAKSDARGLASGPRLAVYPPDPKADGTTMSTPFQPNRPLIAQILDHGPEF